jgi:hypothetical protein
MPGFDPAAYGPTIASLLGDGRAMPLDGGRPDGAVRARLTGLDLDQLLAPGRVLDREMAEACLAALWLLGDDLDRSHRISQGLHGQDGCYWHGIMHRREGDYSNAKYWMRRVGEHPIHDALNRAAGELAGEASGDAAFLGSQANWDAYAFVDLCEAAGAGRGDAADLCRQIQQREWQLLFDHCYQRAVGDARS